MVIRVMYSSDEDVPTFILIGRVNPLPGWNWARRGMSLIHSPEVLKEVSVLEGT